MFHFLRLEAMNALVMSLSAFLSPCASNNQSFSVI